MILAKSCYFDVNKIKVTVTKSYTKQIPVVRLKRLSKSTIAKYTQNSIPKSNDQSVATHNHKNDKTDIIDKPPVAQHSYATRARKQYLSDEPKNNTKKTLTFNSKRRSDSGSATLTIAKKQKISEENCLPRTIETADANEISQQNIKTSTVNNVVAVLEYSINEVVWGKIRGWPHWPARITSIEGRRFEVQWFNDYRKTKLFRTQLFKFYKHYDEFSKLFDSKIGLETAAKEAVILLAHKANNN